MNNPFIYSFNEKRYHTYNYYLKTNYNGKVAKVIIDGHNTCPNRDGNKGVGGCSFCNSKGAGESNKYSKEDFLTQYENNKKIMDNKWHNSYYIPYFQSYSNTYCSIAKLQTMIEPFINKEEVKEIAIASRCDCLNEANINYLKEVANIKPLVLELGLQTSNDKTGKSLNRCYNFSDFLKAINLLSKTNIKICVHIINSLPQETTEDMLNTVNELAHLPIHFLKIHMLAILKGSPLSYKYLASPFKLLSRDEYIEIVVKQLELLNPKIVIERLTEDPDINELIEPKWLINKTTVLNDIDKLMRKLDTYQGKYFHEQ